MEICLKCGRNSDKYQSKDLPPESCAQSRITRLNSLRWLERSGALEPFDGLRAGSWDASPSVLEH